MKALVDINVLLDVALDRDPFVADALAVARACAQGRCRGFVSAITVPTLFYIVRRSAGLAKAQQAVGQCLAAFEVVPVDRWILEAAQTYPGPDYEDNVQISCAVALELDCIVTRNGNDFRASPVAVLPPADLLERLGPQ